MFSRATKVLPDFRGNLAIGQLVGRFHYRDRLAAMVSCKAFLQLALGLAGAHNQDRIRVMQEGDDRIIIFIQVVFEAPIALVLGRIVVPGRRLSL